MSWPYRRGRARKIARNRRLASPHRVACRLMLLCVLFPVSDFLLAQESPSANAPRSESSSATMLDELEIIAGSESAPRTGDVVSDEHTGSRSRVTQERLSQPGSQLADLLSDVSGVQQRQSGGFGSFSTISVRAASAAQTAVYLDGILLNTGGESVIDLSTLDILNLASVDVYKGSTPLQLGHAGMGGAVNLNTTRADEDQKTHLRQGFGSFDFSSVAAAHQTSSGNWDSTATFSRQQSDNDFPFTNNNATPLNPFDDSRQRRANNRVERTSILLKTGYQSTDNHRSDLLIQMTERDIGVATARNSALDRASYETVKTQIQLSQVIDQWQGWNTRHSLYWHISDSIYDDSRSQVGLGAQYIDSDIRTLGAKTYWERFLDIGTLGLSVDLRNESLDLEDELNDNENFTADRQLLTATTHLAVLDDDDRWMVTPALRWQHSQRKGTSTSIGVPTTLLEQDESEFGAQLGITYSITPVMTFNANAGNYFREPSFNELFGSIGLVNGNPSLEPESGVNSDFGLSYDTDKLHLEIALFRNRHDNLILNSFDARGIGRPGNTGKAQVEGVELSANWMFLPDWQLTANATFQNPRNRDLFKGYTNRILPGQSRRTGFARLTYQHADISYWYEWKTTGERFYDSTNSLPAADTSLHSIGIDVNRKRWSISARLQNIGDDNVEDFNGFAKPGRSFFIAIAQSL
ncbi:MAG: TonB-dependent receptor [Granulosicoccus sp.]